MNTRLISIFPLALVLALAAGCARQGEADSTAEDATPEPTEQQQSADAADTVEAAQARDEELQKSLPPPKITPVTIKVTLSPKAEAELKRTGETVMVDVVYGGDATAAYVKENNEMGVIELGRVKRELKGADTFTLSEDVINKAQLTKTLGQPQLLINAISGKKSSPKNILACDFYWETLSEAGKGTVTIPCKLLSEVTS